MLSLNYGCNICGLRRKIYEGYLRDIRLWTRSVAYWWLSLFARLRENYKYSRMSLAHNFSYFSIGFFITFLIQRLLNRVKLGWNHAKISQQTCVKLQVSRNDNKQLTVENVGYISVTAYKVDLLVFSGTALSTSRFISSSFTNKANRSAILTLI